MQIIEIKALENGAHNNQTSSAITAPPPGWAEVPCGDGRAGDVPVCGHRGRGERG